MEARSVSTGGPSASSGSESALIPRAFTNAPALSKPTTFSFGVGNWRNPIPKCSEKRNALRNPGVLLLGSEGLIPLDSGVQKDLLIL